ncbi:TIGR02449 family protein [Spiribacter salinus]|uniref:TIGR02449 family protein n=1 Tax=Spiribacter salinus TaxID=1335746 RepID=UPI001C988EE4|nr:TIGR02449 family protein [Spiribacter salinus]MBY5268723.1 TIGR02449 family protein [Spiribacter salinus]MDR9455393.1 TIGR02449 family protein [Spiribacter sp.]
MVDSVTEQVIQLEQRVDRLIRLCDQLRDENRVLLNAQESLNAERAALLDKNETARARLEAMISRLKALEQS